MISLPQRGGCACGEVRFALAEDPVVVYACHCTDCQTETGSVCLIAVVVRRAAVEFTGAQPESCVFTLPDGREKGGLRCPTCRGALGGASRGDGLMTIEGGTFDDTSWVEPAGHIWTRSAQPWIRIPENAVSFAEQPAPEDFIGLARAWKQRDR